MKTSTRLLFILFFLFLLIPYQGFTQETTKDSLVFKIKIVARDIMTSAATCALITLDEENHPSIRMMDPFLPEKDFTVWLATNPNSKKVAQIKKNPKVTLYYLEVGETGYVMLQGTAVLVADFKEKEKRFKEGWEAFYPNKTTDYLLIKVTPIAMEVVSYPQNLLGDTITWEAPKINFQE